MLSIAELSCFLSMNIKSTSEFVLVCTHRRDSCALAFDARTHALSLSTTSSVYSAHPTAPDTSHCVQTPLLSTCLANMPLCVCSRCYNLPDPRLRSVSRTLAKTHLDRYGPAPTAQVAPLAPALHNAGIAPDVGQDQDGTITFSSMACGIIY